MASRVPANDVADALLENRVARADGLLVRGNGVYVVGRGVEVDDAAGPSCPRIQLRQQIRRALGAAVLQDGAQGIQPFTGLGGVEVRQRRMEDG